VRAYWTVNGKALLVPAAVDTDVLRERRVADEFTWKVAVIVVELTTTTLLTLVAPPWTATVAGDVKLVPVSVTFTVAPRGAAFGASDVKVGFAGGVFTVKD
jgi:hypothetical protein